MQTTYRAQEQVVQEREKDGRAEIDRLRDQIETVVSTDDEGHPRETLDSALSAVTRLQVAGENLEACHPPSDKFAGPALVALADRCLRGAPDAIERGMTYTADNQMRLLQTKERPAR
jgi:hypothetical protein